MFCLSLDQICNNFLNGNVNSFLLRKVTWRIKKKNYSGTSLEMFKEVMHSSWWAFFFLLRRDKLCFYITSYKALYKSLQIYIFEIFGLHSHVVALKKNHWSIKDKMTLYFCLLYKSRQYFCMYLFVLWICVGLHVCKRREGQGRVCLNVSFFLIKYNAHKLVVFKNNNQKKDDKQTHEVNKNCSKQAIQYSTYGLFFL